MKLDILSLTGVVPFCTILWGIAVKEEVIHILEKGAACAACGLPWKAGEVSGQCLPKEGRQVFKPLWEVRPSQLHFTPCVWFDPFKGKQGLAWGAKQR